ncbi:GTP-binding protein gtr2 [Sporothrix bragantina]|uniref:GTP-binding protein gtr2 n=1 Tax=Sporothrix bragantina TaxID=671064 RepID=A0ABP0CY81_9PEZI
MNHTAIADNLTQYQGDIQYLRQNYPNVTYVLGETNSDYVNTNMWAIEGVFGSALWMVDYLMFGMTQNITRMHLIQGTNFGYTAWVPVESNGRAPYVRPPLFGLLFHADVIGRSPEIQVQEVSLNQWDFSAYAVYNTGKLAKYVVVNLDEWNSTTPYARPQKTVTITAPSSSGIHCQHGGMVAKVQRLTAGGASADSGITWGGLTWNYTDGRLAQEGRPAAETIVFDAQGRADLTIASSEAVLVTFL